ncbi:hypothetical protein HD554DRAFT_2324338 [Boletus coccyginus]|nr:hypothetical protein HD554DRAFT_2324338 [Boletus coccyginus]
MSKNKQKKRKGKTTANAKVRGNPNENDAQATSSQQCLSLMEDEITRCGQLATEGHPKPERCKVHHKQYRTLCRKYKEASEAVDNVKGDSQLPTQEQIGRYKSWHAALEKARWVRKYLEAIRVETAGREIHQKRFFLKVDDGHRRRLKLLEREMVRAVGVLDALQGRAYELYKPERTLCAINDRAPPKAETEWGRQAVRATVELLERIPNPDVFHESPPLMPPLTMPTTSSVGDEDLIDMSLRGQKEKMFVVLKPLMGFESFVDSVVGNTPPKTRGDKSLLEKRFFIHQQFARRIIFHQPTLFMKSLGRVSLKDLVLCDDFSMEDFSKFLGLLMNPMGFPLKWFKDAVLDALAISRHGTAANVGSVESRFSLLGGWVFNRSHTSSMSNEAWWFLLTMLDPPADVENRFVRLCNNFEDLVGFLSFEAFGLVPRPSFCESPSHFDPNDPGLSRNHLSLSGIIVADMISTALPPQMQREKRDCIVWAEVESRAYMFGAVRNERDGFVEAFMRELRARPDLFQVVLRSDTDPGRKVETFGLGPSNNGALPVAPGSSPPSPPPSASDEWKVEWSAMDVLYGSQREMLGYLTILARDLKGWFFRFKTFPVTYFVIVDAVPSRDKSVLARNVSWAALRAGGYAEGEYTLRKYAAASDKLLEQCAQERLGWMSEEMKREIPMVKMQDQMGRTSWKARQQSRQTTVALDTDTDDGDSSNVVGDVQDGAELPTLEEIGQYTDRHAVLEKVSRVCDYLEAIRVEKSEREIHQKQVFLEGECK